MARMPSAEAFKRVRKPLPSSAWHAIPSTTLSASQRSPPSISPTAIVHRIRGRFTCGRAAAMKPHSPRKPRAILRDLDPMLPLYDVRTFSQHIERNLYLRRIPARMFAVLGPLLLGLAAVGS